MIMFEFMLHDAMWLTAPPSSCILLQLFCVLVFSSCLVMLCGLQQHR